MANAGTISMASGDIGVYVDPTSTMDFPVTLTGDGATGVFAAGGSTISGSIDASGSTDTIGLFTEDATVTMNGVTIKTGAKNAAANTAIGWFQGGTSQTYSTSGNTIEATSADTVGVYVPTGNTYDFGDTVTADNGAVGILTNGAGATLNTNNGTMNVGTSSVGIVANAGSTANIGTTGGINVNFTGTSGVLAFANGGTINLGTSII